MALMKQLNCFWTLGLSLVVIKLSKAWDKIPKLPTIHDPEFIQEVVNSHNEIRSNINPSAANMNALNWDKDLAKLAKSWSKQCQFLHNPCIGKKYACIEDYDFIGENLYLTGIRTTLKRAISSWYNENEHYNFENMTCSKICGHYTQLVWDSTYKVGCAVTPCSKVGAVISAALFICNYAPGGTLIRRPYQAGTFCTRCHPDDQCTDLLCSNTDCDEATYYQFWYPHWEVPRPLMCDPLCLFILSLRVTCFVLCVIIVLIMQSQFPDILSEKQMFYERKMFSVEEEVRWRKRPMSKERKKMKTREKTTSQKPKPNRKKKNVEKQNVEL
ncbi:GLIPR1-like protein 1 [Cricetulus griseus]|uniref:GLIPR1-like protein 1 n=1 Tax=Cricetulus griseus TaxID=10029 RepID=A0A9J7F163_CRIGR|nr:GLIPR1-like protein 1 [Cricetulus griseus]